MAENNRSKWQDDAVSQLENGDVLGGLNSIARGTQNADRYDATIATIIQQLNRDEDFKRSTPQAQIQRLMAAGLSRSQAISALQGEQYSQVSPQIAGNVEQTEIEKMNAISSIITQSVAILESVFQLGTQIAMAPAAIKQAKATAQMAQNQSIFSGMQLQASQDVGKFAQAMYNWHSYTGNDYPTSVDDMIKTMKSVSAGELPDVYELGNNGFNDAMKNPYFYPALKQMYRGIFMDKQDLATEYVQSVASAKLADINLDKATAEAELLWSRYRVQESTSQAVIEQAEYTTRIAGSQAAMSENELTISNIDTKFWSQFNGKFRTQYLHNQTEMQAYQTALAHLNVKKAEYFDPLIARECANKLAVAQKLGPEYFNLEAENLMKNEEYRNAVLQCGLMKYENIRQLRQDAQDNANAPFLTDQWFGYEFVKLADYFKDTGVLDKGIQFGADALGFMVTHGL